MAISEVTATTTPTPLRLRVAAEVRAWRARRSMTQQQLARALGLSQPQLSAKERGTTPITLDEIDQLAGIFGCEPDDLIGDAQTPVTPDSRTTWPQGQDCTNSTPTPTGTHGDQLAARRTRRNAEDALPHLPRTVIATRRTHLRLAGMGA